MLHRTPVVIAGQILRPRESDCIRSLDQVEDYFPNVPSPITTSCSTPSSWSFRRFAAFPSTHPRVGAHDTCKAFPVEPQSCSGEPGACRPHAGPPYCRAQPRTVRTGHLACDTTLWTVPMFICVASPFAGRAPRTIRSVGRRFATSRIFSAAGPCSTM
jgi:hypothetical protein